MSEKVPRRRKFFSYGSQFMNRPFSVWLQSAERAFHELALKGHGFSRAASERGVCGFSRRGRLGGVT
jgi:hypothetical protein